MGESGVVVRLTTKLAVIAALILSDLTLISGGPVEAAGFLSGLAILLVVLE